MEHPTTQDLVDFAEGKLGRQKARSVVAHFLRGCQQCRDEASRLRLSFLRLGRAQEVAREADYDRVLDRAQELARALVAQRAAAQPEPSPRPADAGQVEALLESAWALSYENVEEMLRLAHEAVHLAESLPRQGEEARRVADLRCSAWTHLGNSLRIAARYPEAESALERAACLLDEGTGSTELRTRIYDFRASLYGVQRRFQPCWAALDMVYSLHRESGRRHLAGRALISKAIYKGYAGHSHESLQLTSEGLALIDPEADPELLLIAVQNQVWTLVECGLLLEARGLLDQYRPRWGKDTLNELKLRWIEGRIAAGIGELPNALQHLWAAREGFAAAGLPYRAAMVSLDLGTLLLQRGQTVEARQALVQAVDTFYNLQVTQETLAAAEILRRALEMEATPLILISHIAEFLRRLTGDPICRLEPLGG
jgi:tetratricopeptide (TPR) repeat protein